MSNDNLKKTDTSEMNSDNKRGDAPQDPEVKSSANESAEPPKEVAVKAQNDSDSDIEVILEDIVASDEDCEGEKDEADPESGESDVPKYKPSYLNRIREKYQRWKQGLPTSSDDDDENFTGIETKTEMKIDKNLDEGPTQAVVAESAVTEKIGSENTDTSIPEIAGSSIIATPSTRRSCRKSKPLDRLSPEIPVRRRRPKKSVEKVKKTRTGSVPSIPKVRKEVVAVAVSDNNETSKKEIASSENAETSSKEVASSSSTSTQNLRRRSGRQSKPLERYGYSR